MGQNPADHGSLDERQLRVDPSGSIAIRRTAESGVKDGVQAVRANRRMGFTPAVPPRSRERPKSAHRVEPAAILAAPYRTTPVSANGPYSTATPADPYGCPNEEGRQDAALDGSLLLTGRLVGVTNFARSLPKALNLIHREEARQFDVMNGTSGYSDTGYSRCHCGVSHVENHHHTGTIGSPPVHRDKLAPGG